MEYTFKNSISESKKTILLQPDRIVVQFPECEESFTYDRILSVKLTRSKKNLFALNLIFDQGFSVLVTNKYFLSAKEYEDCSRAYTIFVCVLHFHLQEKGRAKYYSGFSTTHLMTFVMGSAFGAFIVSFVSEYVGFSVINSLVLAPLLTVFTVGVALVVNRRFFQKGYNPLNIPLQFLP